MNVQRIASIARQVVAVLAVVFGLLTQSVSALHLPVAVSTVLTAFGGVIFALEHFLGDPSTGTTASSSPAPATPAAAPVPALSADMAALLAHLDQGLAAVQKGLLSVLDMLDPPKAAAPAAVPVPAPPTAPAAVAAPPAPPAA